jgi:hypothetical protein
MLVGVGGFARVSGARVDGAPPRARYENCDLSLFSSSRVEPNGKPMVLLEMRLAIPPALVRGDEAAVVGVFEVDFRWMSSFCMILDV